MRNIVAPLLAAVLSGPSVAAEIETRFPYTAFAVADATPVRSGPGEAFYPVLNLKLGDAVEVWRHDDGGWCAIRPPEGAFSWIAAEFVETVDGRNGTVVGNEVNVRIGTQFSPLRDAIAVRLGEGETVDILAEGVLNEDGRENRWLKIAPPSGEFRWIHERQLVRDPTLLPARRVGFEEPADDGKADFAALDALPADAPVEKVLAELESVLSKMVAAEPTAWHFDELRRRADALVERSPTALERSKARLYLGKLERFDDIRKRYAAVTQIRTETAEVDRQLITAGARPVKAALDGSTDTARYDGVGRLTRIVTAADGPATYALTDEAGEIKAYVNAAPGVNLRQYTGLEVGINGIKGYVAEERKELLTAKRIDVLSAR